MNKSTKIAFLKIVEDCMRPVIVNGIYCRWDCAKSKTKIMQRLMTYNEYGKIINLSQELQDKLICNCLDEDLIELIKIDNKKIIKLTTKGYEYITSFWSREFRIEVENLLKKIEHGRK